MMAPMVVAAAYVPYALRQSTTRRRGDEHLSVTIGHAPLTGRPALPLQPGCAAADLRLAARADADNRVDLVHVHTFDADRKRVACDRGQEVI